MSPNRYKDILTQAPVAIGELSADDLKVVSANNALLEIWGKTDDVIGLRIAEVLPSLAGKALLPLLEGVLNDGISYYSNETHTVITRNNKQEDCFFNFVYAPVKDAEGTVCGIMIIANEVTTQVKAKRELEESERRFKGLIIDAPTATAMYVGKEMKIQLANEAMLNLWGKDSSVIGMPLKDALPELKGQIFHQLLEDVYTTGMPFHTDEAIADLIVDGKLQSFYFNFTYKPLYNSEGEVYAILNMAVDITSQVHIKQKLKETEEYLRFALESADVGTWSLDPKSQLVKWDLKCRQLYGFSDDEQVAYEELLKHVHPEDVNRVIATVEEALNPKSGGNYSIEFRTIGNADKLTRWIRCRGRAYFNDSDEPYLFTGTALEITDEKQYNEQLMQMVQQFEFVTDFMPQIVWSTKPNGDHDFYNQRWYDFTGQTFESTKDQGWSIVLHPDDLERTRKVWKECLMTGKPYEIEYRLRRYDNEYRWMLGRALPLRNEAGDIVKWFGTCTDFHDQKQLQQQKDDFLGIASHELKTPVTSIKAYAQVLEAMLKKKGDLREASMVAKMDAQVNRLTNLIGDLLDVTKINSGRLLFNEDKFAFNDMVKEVVEELQRTSQKHRIIEELNSNVVVFGDRDRIGQVITNFITNAVKYSPQADHIVIRTYTENSQAVLCVQDFGVGIPEDKQEKVFEQFYRVSGDKQHTFPGLGLGLYISHEIIKREGGKIWVDSIEGSGSTFCFSLPVHTQDKQA